MRQLANGHHYLERRGYSNFVFDAEIAYAQKGKTNYFGTATKISTNGCVIKGEFGKVQ